MLQVPATSNRLVLRYFPRNLTYKRLDAMEAFPFETASFDIVHIRLLLIHVSIGLSYNIASLRTRR